MKNFIKVSITLLIAALPIQYIQAQSIDRQVIGTGGGNFKSSTIQSDHTVGEAITTTLIKGTFVLSQGFQQPESGGVVGKVIPKITVKYSLYPNPAAEYITLELNSDARGEVLISIVNMLGQQLYMQSKVVNIYPQYKETFSIDQFAAGAYIFNIYQKDGRLIHAIKFTKKE